jgi:beta-lactamase class A
MVELIEITEASMPLIKMEIIETETISESTTEPKLSGQHIQTYNNGDKYEGNFENGVRIGQGTYTWANGIVYIGEFIDGEPSDTGNYIYPTTEPPLTTEEPTNPPPTPEPTQIFMQSTIQNEAFDKVESIIESYGDTISVFYKDLTSGDTYIYNKDSQYYIASMIKTPYAVYLYRLALNDVIDISSVIEYGQADVRENAPGIGNTIFGAEFTIEELIGYSIRYSDNTAFQMLVRKFGYAGFQKYFENQGLILKSGMSMGLRGMTSIECIAFYLEQINEFIEENNIYSNIFKEHMLNTEVKLTAFNGAVGRKYGFDGVYLHEMCIIYDGKTSYLFALLTKGYQNNYNVPFGDIPNAIAEYNNFKN